MTQAPTITLATAREYAARGWYVFPVRVTRLENGKKAVSPIASWRERSTIDPLMITNWFEGEWSDAQVAIDTGKSNIVVIDLDVSGGKRGPENWSALGAAPSNYAVRTPGLGAHFYYRADPNNPIGNDSTGKLGEGVDVRGVGGFVFAPPSTDGSGSWSLVGDPDWSTMPTVPAVVVERLGAIRTEAQPTADPVTGLTPFRPPAGTPRYTVEAARQRMAAVLQEVMSKRQGEGFNHALNEAAFEVGHFVGGGLLSEDDGRALLEAAVWHVFPGGPDRDDLGTIESGLRSGMNTPYVTYSEAVGAVLGQTAAHSSDAVTAMRSKILRDDDLDTIQEPEPIVTGWLFRDSLARVFGPSGGGKSFAMIDLAAHVATGRPWHGVPVSKGRVLYVVGEGLSGYRKRVKAWRSRHKAESAGVDFYPEAIQVSDQASWAVLEALVGEDQYDMIVFDTQARMTVGMDENNATDMGLMIHQLDRLRLASKACVVLVHHTGHTETERARGSSAVYGAMTSEIQVGKDGNRVTITTRKQKDIEETAPRILQLVPELDSAVLELIGTAPTPAQTQGATGDVFTVDGQLVTMEESATLAELAESSQAVRVVALWMSRRTYDRLVGATKTEIWAGIEEMYRSTSSGSPPRGVGRSKVNEAVAELYNRGLIAEGQSPSKFIWVNG